MEAGKLREQIALQAKTPTRDAIGGEVLTWTTQATVWASVDAITGREVHAAGQLHSAATLRVIIGQPGPSPDASWRVLWNGKVLSILAVLPYPARDRLTLLCSQGLKDQ